MGGGALDPFANDVEVWEWCLARRDEGVLFLGEYLLAKGEYQRVVESMTGHIDARKTTKKKEEFLGARSLRARAYFFLGRGDEAIADLDVVLSAGPANSAGRCLDLAVRCWARVRKHVDGKLKDDKVLLLASKDCMEALALDPNNPVAGEAMDDVKVRLEELRTGKSSRHEPTREEREALGEDYFDE